MLKLLQIYGDLDEYNITYLGNEFTVRDINARAWYTETSDTVEYNGSKVAVDFETTFYFADDWDYYTAIETSDIPLSAEHKGSWTNLDSGENGTFDTKYQMVSFFSGPEAFDDEDAEFVFEDWYAQCDVSAYCDKYDTNMLCSESRGPEMPTVPDQFFAVFEATTTMF